MAEIACKKCLSPDCKGCNIFILETALKQGKFDALMDDNKTIHICDGVRENVKAREIIDQCDNEICSNCGCQLLTLYTVHHRLVLHPGFCPNCGAEMQR